MSKGWQVKRLGELCEVQRGLTYSRKDTADFSSTVVLRATNISLDKSSLDFSELKYLRDDFEIKDNYKLKEGSLLVCFSSGSKSHLGKVALVDRYYDAAFGGFIGQINPKEKVNSKYLFYILISDAYKKYISKLADGININNLKSKDLKDFSIPIPPLSEQKQIVTILDQAFAAIDQAKANVEQNLVNGRELFQSKLNEVFSQKGEGWEETTLGEVCELYQGLAINAKTKHLLVEKSSLVLLRIKDLKNNIESQYVAEEGYPEQSRIDINDIIYTRTGSLGLVFRGRKGILHNNSFKVVPREQQLSNDYLFWWLQHDAFKNKIMALASRAAQPDITHKLFKQQRISVPSKEQQKKYSDEIKNLSKLNKRLLKMYRNKFEYLNDLKKSILLKAFNGELTSKPIPA